MNKTEVAHFKTRVDDELGSLDGGESYIAEYTFLASGWDNGEYSLEEDYPSSDYDIWEISPSNDNTTAAMLSAWKAAGITGCESTNEVVAKKTAPSIDIIMTLFIKKKKEEDSGFKIVTFADGTDAEIKAMLDAYYNNEITWAEMGWAVGDTRVIHFNAMPAPRPIGTSKSWSAQDITIVIVDHDHTDLATAINGHTKACITVQTRECMNNTSGFSGQPGQIFVTGQNSNNFSYKKWSELYMRTYLNSTVFEAIPEGDFKSAIKQSNHYRHTAYNTSADELVTDTLFLPSYPELLGNVGASSATTHTEGTQFEYYKTAANIVKYGNDDGESSGIPRVYWTGSIGNYYDSNNGYFWGAIVNTINNNGVANLGSVAQYQGLSSFSLSPAWAM